MRGLLVNNEDLLRSNTQLANEMKRMSDRMMELERESQVMGERYRSMEVRAHVWIDATTHSYSYSHLHHKLPPSLYC